MGKNEQLMTKTDVLLTTGLSYTLSGYVAYTCQLLLLLLLYTSSYGSRQLLFTFSDSLVMIISIIVHIQ